MNPFRISLHYVLHAAYDFAYLVESGIRVEDQWLLFP